MSAKHEVSLRGLQYPDSKNPYTRLWRDALFRQGVTFSVASRPQDFLGYALSASKPDLVHLHWVHPVSRNFLLGILKFLIFQAGLLVFWMRGVKIFWTIHNLVPHEKQHIWLDCLNNWLVARLVSGAFVHGESAIPLVSRALSLPEDRLHCAFHGNYAGVMPAPEESAAAAREVGSHFLYFGLVRPYKGVLDLIREYSRLPIVGTLTIAGDPQGAEMRDAVEVAAAGDSRIRLRLDYLDDEELACLIRNADVVVLPFQEVFTSGSLVMSMTMGKPVVVPRAGLLVEYVDEDCAFFYPPGDSRGLSKALQKAAKSDEECLLRMGEAAASRAERLNWDGVATGMVAVYRQFCKR